MQCSTFRRSVPCPMRSNRNVCTIECRRSPISRGGAWSWSQEVNLLSCAGGDMGRSISCCARARPELRFNSDGVSRSILTTRRVVGVLAWWGRFTRTASWSRLVAVLSVQWSGRESPSACLFHCTRMQFHPGMNRRVAALGSRRSPLARARTTKRRGRRRP